MKGLKNLILIQEMSFFQGSIQLYRKLRAETPARPLGWMTDNSYKCSVYYPYFQNFLFNNQHCFVGLGTLKKEKWFFYSVFGKDALIYVRPDAGDKLFTGRLLDLIDFDKFFDPISSESAAKNNDLIVVSSPKNIRGEYRFIIKGKEIVAHSTYLYMGQRTCIPSVNPKAAELCKKILKTVDYSPDPVYTIDICEDKDGECWMLELNSFTSAGLYGADKHQIVKEISKI
jgi:hypothetical protein